MLTLDAAAVERLSPHIDTLAEMRALFGALAQGKAVQPPQTLALFPENKGDFITYLGAEAGAGVFGAKLSPYLPRPGARPIITAWTLLMSMETGQPLMLCDSGRLTTERTAGVTALAVDFLAAPEASSLAIIGAGPVARAHWRLARGLRRWSSVRLYAPRLASDAERLAAWRAEAPRVVIAASAAEAVRGADVVMLCTSSGAPVISPADLAAAAVVTSISTNAPLAHEVPPEFLKEAEVYCDYKATTPGTAGEMILAARDHGWSPGLIRGDLADLTAGRADLPSRGRPVFFRSVGLGLEDIAMARAVYRAATA